MWPDKEKTERGLKEIDKILSPLGFVRDGYFHIHPDIHVVFDFTATDPAKVMIEIYKTIKKK